VSWWGEHEHFGDVEVSFETVHASIHVMTLKLRIRGSDQVQHSNHAVAAKLNVFNKHMMVLTEGMALKAVMLGSLALALLA
jgi:hypothetical protein